MRRELIIAMALGLAGAAMSSITADAAQPAASAPTASDAGQRVYTRWCRHCHDAGRGNPGTESLRVKYGDKLPAVLLDRTDLSPQAVTQFVRQGVLSMPPFRKTEITDAELAALSVYVARNAGSR